MRVSFASNAAALLVGIPLQFMVSGSDLEPWLQYLIVLLPTFGVEVLVLVKSRGFRNLFQAIVVAVLMNVASNVGLILFWILVLPNA